MRLNFTQSWNLTTLRLPGQEYGWVSPAKALTPSMFCGWLNLQSGPTGQRETGYLPLTPYSERYFLFPLRTLVKILQLEVPRGVEILERRHWAAILFFYGTVKCIVAYDETSETRWRRSWLCTLNVSSLVYPGRWKYRLQLLSRICSNGSRCV